MIFVMLLMLQGPPTFASLWALAFAHPTISTLLLYMVFSNAVQSLPSTSPTSGKFYLWSFNFLHLMASSLPRIVPALRFGNSNGNGNSNGGTPPPAADQAQAQGVGK